MFVAELLAPFPAGSAAIHAPTTGTAGPGPGRVPRSLSIWSHCYIRERIELRHTPYYASGTATSACARPGETAGQGIDNVSQLAPASCEQKTPQLFAA